jgi:hypothetical protein
MILEHPIFRKLLSLKLPPNDFTIAGSGPLFARGWIKDPTDVDVVARGRAWELAVRVGQARPAPYSTVNRVVLFGGEVDILDGWFPEVWPVDYLIASSDMIAGLRFVTLDVVAATKRKMMRPRDIEHLQIMEMHGFNG